MSKQDAETFIKQVAADDNLRKKVSAATDQIIKVASDQGLQVTQQELREALRDHWKGLADNADAGKVPFSEAPGF